MPPKLESFTRMSASDVISPCQLHVFYELKSSPVEYLRREFGSGCSLGLYTTPRTSDKLGFDLGSDLVNEPRISVPDLQRTPGIALVWSRWTTAALFAERTDSLLTTAQVLGQGFELAVVLAVGALWGHPRVPQVGKPPSPWGKWESWWGRSSSLLRAGNKSEPVRGLNDVSRRRWPHLQCISAKKRTEWLIAAACMFVGYRGMEKLYLCQCSQGCFSYLHPDDTFIFLLLRLKWLGSPSFCLGARASKSSYRPFHSPKVSGPHHNHVICALRIRGGASEDDNMGGHQGLSEGLLAHSCRIIRWHALRVSISIFAPPYIQDAAQPWCRRMDNLFLSHSACMLTCIRVHSWDTGLIGGVLTMDAFQHSFDLDPESSDFANLQGNIVSVLQGGCFFGAAASFWLSDKIGRKWSLISADLIFIIGSIIQTCSGLGTTDLTQLYIGRFIGGFGVGLISAVVPTYIGENANREIRGRCIGW